MRRLAIAGALAATALLVPNAHAAGPQVLDPAGDANFTDNGNGLPRDTTLGVGNQTYADVLSVEWKTVKDSKRKVTGYQIVAKLSGPPVPPSGRSVVYAAQSATSFCFIFSVAYYPQPSGPKQAPQAVLRYSCTGSVYGDVPLALPVIAGNTITWTVPFKVIPKVTTVGVGTTFRNMGFSVREVLDFRGQCLPDVSGVPNDGGCDRELLVVDRARSEAAFQLR